MFSSQILTVHYPTKLAQKITKIFNALNQQYAIIYLMQNNSELSVNLLIQKNRILLKKRKTYFIILVGQQSHHLSDSAQYSMLVFTSDQQQKQSMVISKQYITKHIKNHYKLDGNLSCQDLSKKIIQLLQLDFIWIGFLSRLGSSINEFAVQLTQKQNFQQIEIGQQVYFIEQLNKQLGEGLSFQLALYRTQIKLDNLGKQMNDSVESYVMQKFNSRFLISHITFTQYFKLLLSRNYFHLIYIECSILDRFNNFQERVKFKYPHISEILSLQTFVQIDDFWYSHFIQKCTPFARYTINRIITKQPHSQVIKSNMIDKSEYYSKIIRQFRPNFDEYFIQICYALKDRAACIKQAIGAIIVKQKRIIATGYNGTPIGSVNCYNGGCRVCNNSENINTQVLSCNCIHAQYSCILQAGIKVTPGCTLYTTGLPCLWCTKLIIQAKIHKVIYVQTSYSKLKHENEDVILETFKDAGIQLKEVKHQQRILSD